MKSFLLFIQQINFGKALDSCKPDLSKYPNGSATPQPPKPPNDRIIREDGKGLVTPNN